MDARRASLALCTLAAFVLATTPVAAQSVNRDLIDSLYLQLLYVALPLTLFVLVILAYSVVRFRDNDDPQPTAEDPPLEITWTAATAIILLFVGVSSYAVLASPYLSPGVQTDGELAGTGTNPVEVPEDDELVEVVAYQWEWQFVYDEANLTTQNELVLPADEDVTLSMTSNDVIHSLAIPELGVKQDVFPGQESAIRTNVHTTGEYDAFCTEFCGARHAHMRANVTVVDRDTYDEWLDEHADERGVTEAPALED
ncbi:cytochrome c oxidase subunit II [Natronobiforma cellulositropha]|uniref:cytochrome c oxidase subunit II n=1 Tax=Natronobiforma cellulositropha TaxID=1679076 RepID=UPI0021D5FFA8|nr:cytochrome c oxidase subunit II [Natronobiforma cellulositropha]